MAETVRAHIHESPRVMTVPLLVLALGSILAGWLGTPEFMVGSVLDPWLHPIFGAQEHAGPQHAVSEELMLMGWTVGIAAASRVRSGQRNGGVWQRMPTRDTGRPICILHPSANHLAAARGRGSGGHAGAGRSR